MPSSPPGPTVGGWNRQTVGVEGVVVGVDVGGTKVLAGVVDCDGNLRRTVGGSTPGRRVDERMIEDVLTRTVREASDGAQLVGVGVAAAGFVDPPGERVRFAPHLPWQDAPVRQRLEDRWQVPVVLENDAAAAAFAELQHGAARGAHGAIVVTLGTGIGGGVILGKAVYRGTNGMAGEFGHMQVVPDGRPCECGKNGCWEQYASGNALVRYVRDHLGTRPTVLEELSRGNPAAISGPMVSAAAEDGDLVAHEAFQQVGEWLGVGLANLVAAFDPEVLVVGGGVSAAGDRLLEPARLALSRNVVGAGHRDIPPLHAAQLGPEAGLIGAAALLRERLSG